MRCALCTECLGLGYCQRRTARIVSDQELASHAFIYDVRLFAYGLGIPASAWRDTLFDWYRDYPGRVMNRQGREEWLNMEVFEEPFIEDWFERNFVTRPANENAVRMRADTQERLLVAATILRAVHPGPARFWGLRAANDNEA